MNAVIFDMDGLMFDTERLFIRAFDYAGEIIGIGKAGYMGIRTLGMNMNLWRDTFRAEFGDKFDEPTLLKHVDVYINEYYSKNKVPVKKGLYSLLDYFKNNGYGMAVASSSPLRDVTHHINDAGVASYFSAVISGDMVTNSKPDPEIYLKACAQLGQSPENCYALEDSPTGLQSAYSSGCKTILVPDLWAPNEQHFRLCYKVFDSLVEVHEFFLSMSEERS